MKDLYILSCMSRRAASIVLSPEERATIDMWARGKRFPVRLVQRAQIVLMAADGVLNQDIAARIGSTRPTVQLWRGGFFSFLFSGFGKKGTSTGALSQKLAGGD